MPQSIPWYRSRRQSVPRSPAPAPSSCSDHRLVTNKDNFVDLWKQKTKTANKMGLEGYLQNIQNIVTGVLTLLRYILVNSHEVFRPVDQWAQKNLIANKHCILDRYR